MVAGCGWIVGWVEGGLCGGWMGADGQLIVVILWRGVVAGCVWVVV